jgi:hypothetical protein
MKRMFVAPVPEPTITEAEVMELVAYHQQICEQAEIQIEVKRLRRRLVVQPIKPKEFQVLEGQPSLVTQINEAISSLHDYVGGLDGLSEVCKKGAGTIWDLRCEINKARTAIVGCQQFLILSQLEQLGWGWCAECRQMHQSRFFWVTKTISSGSDEYESSYTTAYWMCEECCKKKVGTSLFFENHPDIGGVTIKDHQVAVCYHTSYMESYAHDFFPVFGRVTGGADTKRAEGFNQRMLAEISKLQEAKP